jgi:hypothetical protein
VRGEAAHIDSDLGDHGCGRAPLHAGNRAAQLNWGGERGELRLDLRGEQLDLLVEEVEVGEDRRENQRVLAVEATDQRLA